MRNSEPTEGGASKERKHLKRNDGEESWGNKNKNPRNVVYSQNGFSGEAG